MDNKLDYERDIDFLARHYQWPETPEHVKNNILNAVLSVDTQKRNQPIWGRIIDFFVWDLSPAYAMGLALIMGLSAGYLNSEDNIYDTSSAGLYQDAHYGFTQSIIGQN